MPSTPKSSFSDGPPLEKSAPSGLEPGALNLLEQVWTGDRSDASGERRPARCSELHVVNECGGNMFTGLQTQFEL